MCTIDRRSRWPSFRIRGSSYWGSRGFSSCCISDFQQHWNTGDDFLCQKSEYTLNKNCSPGSATYCGCGNVHMHFHESDYTTGLYGSGMSYCIIDAMFPSLNWYFLCVPQAEDPHDVPEDPDQSGSLLPEPTSCSIGIQVVASSYRKIITGTWLGTYIAGTRLENDWKMTGTWLELVKPSHVPVVFQSWCTQ